MTGTSEEKDYIKVANELTQAFKDIERGEQAAAVLESNLSSLEGKIEDLLKGAEENGQYNSMYSQKDDHQAVQGHKSNSN